MEHSSNPTDSAALENCWIELVDPPNHCML